MPAEPAAVVELDGRGLRRVTDRPTIPAPAPQSVAEVLDAWCAADPDREALVGRHERLSFAALDRSANRAAHALVRLGVRPGDRVAASAGNHTDIVVAFLGAMRLGAVWVGVNRNLAAPEKAHILADAGVSVLLAEPDVVDALRAHGVGCELVTMAAGDPSCEWAERRAEASDERPWIDVDPFAPAAVAYTSGTTGFPKGSVHTQHAMVLPGAVCRRFPELRGTGRLGVALPLTILNLLILGPLTALQSGEACVCIDRIDAVGLAHWIRSERVAVLSMVPTMMYDLLNHPDVGDDDLASLRRPNVGGASVPDGLRAQYRRHFGLRMMTGYGLTEVPTSVTIEAQDRPAHEDGSGWALPHLRVTIRDDAGHEVPPGRTGEICVEPATDGPFAGVYTPFLGYWGDPEATRAALRGGILHTGDLGHLGDDGSLFVEGRESELILRGGANVYPAEVERVLVAHPSVAAAAVVGRDDLRLGQRVVAYVEPADGALVDVEALLAHCRAHVARYKVPSEVLVVDGFVRNAMGKIVKRALDGAAGPGQPSSSTSGSTSTSQS